MTTANVVGALVYPAVIWFGFRARAQRFIELARDYAAGSDDAKPLDEDYLRAMRYGMPPNGGFGMGLDRLTMLLTDKSTIREVILFPHLRSKDEGPRRETGTEGDEENGGAGAKA